MRFTINFLQPPAVGVGEFPLLAGSCRPLAAIRNKSVIVYRSSHPRKKCSVQPINDEQTMSNLSSFSALSKPPYYAVIFSSQRVKDNGEEYENMAAKMLELVEKQVGFLGFESARDPNGFGITVSYWASQEAISAWKDQIDHITAQKMGKSDWYTNYQVRVAKVERSYGNHASSNDTNTH